MSLLTVLEELNEIAKNFLYGKATTTPTVAGGKKMCGSLRHSAWSTKTPIKPGKPLPPEASVTLGGKKVEGPFVWNGFAKVEALDSWHEKFEDGLLSVEGYEEQGKDFSVPKGQAVRVVVMKERKPTGLYLNIVTRPPENPEEASIHHRWPVTVDIPA